MRSSKKIDMTQGPILKLVILFALPITLGNILQQLYSTVDTLVIGNYCGAESLAAVGTSSQPVEFLLCVFLGLGTGVSILVAQCMGGGNRERLKKVITTATGFLYVCAIPLSILGILLTPAFLRLMQVPEESFPLAVSYTQIVFIGTLGNMGYNMNAGILRGVGDSRSSLFFLLISCVVNIVLDLLFVAVLHMDVAGAALATTIAMFASWAFSIVYIRKKFPELGFSILPKRIYKEELWSIIRVGLPLGLNNSIYSVGHIMMQSLSNAQGYLFVAAGSVSGKITGIANVAINSFASAATTFAGQNIGAGNYARLKKGSLSIPLFSGLVTCIAGILFTLFSRPLLGFFTPDPEVLKLAILRANIVLPFTWCYAVLSAIIHYINGIGEMKYPTIINILMLWTVRIPSAYLIARFIHGYYIVAAIPISFVFGMICMLCYYAFSKRWREIKRLAVE